MPLARTVTEGENSATDYYLYDGLGCVMALGNANFSITQTLEYDVWGSQRAGQGSSSNALKYVGSLGHPSDDDTGLIYMRARYYDPDVGRFVSEDPAEDGDNWYAYGDDDPVSSVDPDGESVMSWLRARLAAIMLGKDIGRKKGWGLHEGQRPPGVVRPGKLPKRTFRGKGPGGGGGTIGGGGGRGLGAFGFTTLETYAQQNPEDFWDILNDLGGG